MTILTVVQDVCANVGVVYPASVFAGIANNRTMQEMLSLANEMAHAIGADLREWTRLKATAVFTGDGVVTSPPPYGDGVVHGTSRFNWPAGFRRLLTNSNMYRTDMALTPMRYVADADEWLVRRANNNYDSRGEWCNLGHQVEIWPILPVGTSAQIVYLSKNVVALASGGYGDRFIADNDSFVLDERLLKLGMQWRWRSNKGAPYAEDMGSYSDALAMAMGSDKPAPIIIDRKAVSGTTAYPWMVPT